MNDGADEDQLVLRIDFAGDAIAAVQVVDRCALADLPDELLPQPAGETGVIWTDQASGETLAEGWRTAPTAISRDRDGSAMPESELLVAVPTPTTGAGLLTITLSTDHGPVVLTRYLETDRQ
jgi:hypothetical protein